MSKKGYKTCKTCRKLALKIDVKSTMVLVKETRYRAAFSRVKKKKNRYDRLQRIIQNEAWSPGLVIDPSSPSFGPISGNKETKSNDNDSRRTLQYTHTLFFFFFSPSRERDSAKNSNFPNIQIDIALTRSTSFIIPLP